MGLETLSNAALADRLGVTARAVRRALAVFNAVIALPASASDRADLLEQLSEGPGVDIGPRLAAALVELGAVEAFAALTRVHGIGERRLAALATSLSKTTPDKVRAAASQAGTTGLVDGLAEGLAEARAAIVALRERLGAAEGALAEAQAASDRQVVRIAALEARVDELVRRGDAPAPDRSPARLDEDATGLQVIAASAGEQLDEARTKLLGTRHGLRLGDVQVAVRGEAAATADQRLGLRLGPAADAASLSELTMEYAVSSTEPTRAPASLAVPRLTGYTQALARRKLEALGLTSDFSRQSVLDRSQAGRVVAQSPDAGEPIAPGALVRCFVGL